jgi:hypothetical protein
MSRPEITIHKKNVIEKNPEYEKRSQRDYSMSFKLQIVSEIAPFGYQNINRTITF